ncbi:MAG: class I SAM-dependent methyltransferase [Tabrizicola sp.]|nr:class I SAM-dependent methyltransferase [Tabrizicola sp.]
MSKDGKTKGEPSAKNAEESVFKRAAREAQQLAGGTAHVEDGLTLYAYPDYDTYRAVQTAGNKAKLKRQFVKESHVVTLSQAIDAAIGPVSFGLCHGTRRGLEQAWFTAHLTGAPHVLGTEISDTATDFPNTVQWDFHDSNPDWLGRADFVYSNSWDHAFDPGRAFAAWVESLRPGGWLLLDHNRNQAPESANALDPFGVTYERLVAMLEDQFRDTARLLPVIDTRKTNPDYKVRTVILQKNA